MSEDDVHVLDALDEECADCPGARICKHLDAAHTDIMVKFTFPADAPYRMKFICAEKLGLLGVGPAKEDVADEVLEDDVQEELSAGEDLREIGQDEVLERARAISDDAGEFDLKELRKDVVGENAKRGTKMFGRFGNAFTRIRKKKLVENVGYGRWKLVDKGSAPPAKTDDPSAVDVKDDVNHPRTSYSSAEASRIAEEAMKQALFEIHIDDFATSVFSNAQELAGDAGIFKLQDVIYRTWGQHYDSKAPQYKRTITAINLLKRRNQIRSTTLGQYEIIVDKVTRYDFDVEHYRDVLRRDSFLYEQVFNGRYRDLLITHGTSPFWQRVAPFIDWCSEHDPSPKLALEQARQMGVMA